MSVCFHDVWSSGQSSFDLLMGMASVSQHKSCLELQFP